MKKKYIIMTGFVLAIAAFSAWWWTSSSVHTGSSEDHTAEIQRIVPTFNADSAYEYTEAQCSFGPRPMNTKAHDECAYWIIRKFESMGCVVSTQKTDLKGWDGTLLHSTNIIAQYRPEAPHRILLCAHYDSRPWADNDPDSANWRKPIIAANDGASGVGVMLEIARLLKEKGDSLDAQTGVDFVCFDAEDWGTPQWHEGKTAETDTWALGSQYFATHLPLKKMPQYGILLDMVGGFNAKFYQEGISMQYAPDIVQKVWNAARQAGFESYFPFQAGGTVDDDHVALNQKARIPTIDIIPYYPDYAQSSFGPTWHTLQDNMENIDKNTLQAVGQTIVQVLFSEKP